MAKSTNRLCNAFAAVIGLFLHSSNVPERVLEMVAHMGVSIGPTAVNEGVSALSKEASTKLIQLGQTLLAMDAYDNFDVSFNVATPTVESGSKSLAHLTSGTLVRLEHGVVLDDLKCSKEMWERSAFNAKSTKREDELGEHTVFDLLDLHPEQPHMSGLTRRQRFQAWMFRKSLIEHGPAYFQKYKDDLSRDTPESIEQVPVVKTYQVQTLLRQGGVDPETVGMTDISDYVVLFSGDLGTLERVQSILVNSTSRWHVPTLFGERSSSRRMQKLILPARCITRVYSAHGNPTSLDPIQDSVACTTLCYTMELFAAWMCGGLRLSEDIVKMSEDIVKKYVASGDFKDQRDKPANMRDKEQ